MLAASVKCTCLVSTCCSRVRADKPIKVNVILSGVFASHLKHNDDPLGCVETFLQNSLSQLLTSRSQDDGDEEGDQVNYPLLTKSNFYVFYKGQRSVV